MDQVLAAIGCSVAREREDDDAYDGHDDKDDDGDGNNDDSGDVVDERNDSHFHHQHIHFSKHFSYQYTSRLYWDNGNKMETTTGTHWGNIRVILVLQQYLFWAWPIYPPIVVSILFSIIPA